MEDLPSSPSLPLSPCPEQTPNVSVSSGKILGGLFTAAANSPHLCWLSRESGNAGTGVRWDSGHSVLPGLRSPHNRPPESEFLLLQRARPGPVYTGVHGSHRSMLPQAHGAHHARVSHTCGRRPQTRRAARSASAQPHRHAVPQRGLSPATADTHRASQAPPLPAAPAASAHAGLLGSLGALCLRPPSPAGGCPRSLA